jgi:multicomponent Na+:H+ antiporter subunit D
LLKSAIFPLHLWLSNVYKNAPSSVAAFLSGISSNVALYILLRFVYTIIGHEKIFPGNILNQFFLVIAAGGILFGSLSAYYNKDLKRIFAFSSVTQLGYIILAISLGTKQGFITALIFMINHSVNKAALFMICGAIEYRTGKTKLTNLIGLAKKMRFTSAALVINLASLVGMPLTSGFISKWQLMSNILDSNYYLILLVILSTIVTLLLSIKIIEKIYFLGNKKAVLVIHKSSPYMAMSIWLLTACNLALGVCTIFNYQISVLISQIIFRT